MATDNNQNANDPSDDLAHESSADKAANRETVSSSETQSDLISGIDTDLDRDPFEEIASEFSDRYRDGEMPSIDEYVRRHPELEAEIRDLFPTIAAMEQLKERKAPSSPASGGLELEQLGDFRILGEIGRGGMGVVYEAEQVSLGRHVAVKVLPKQALLDERHLRRFEREAQTAAKLHHTNIVPVFGVGQQDGYHYIVMQFIPGVGLDEILIALRTMVLADDSAKYHMDSSSRASHASHNAKALLDGNFSKHVTKNSSFTKEAKRSSSAGLSVGGTAATMELSQSQSFKSTTGTTLRQSSGQQGNHESGFDSDDEAIVPKSLNEDTSDLLSSLDKEFYRSVARIGQQVSDALAYAHEQGTLHRDIKPGNLLLDETGTVWVADFGLAKLAEQDAVSRTGDLVGTLSYMPPESFAGETDARGDVYALGLTLFELLAMRPAYYGRDRGKLVKQITDGELPRLSKLNPSIPRDLETIVLKSVAHRPEDRYATAREMEEDLESFLNDLPIKARRMSLPEQFTRWCRKNKVVASLSAAVLTLLMFSSATFGVLYQQAKKQREIAQKQRVLAEDREGEAIKATGIARDTAKDAIDALLVLFDGIAPNRLPPSADQSLAANGSTSTSEEVGDESETEIAEEETDTATVASAPVTPEMAANLELLLKSFAKLAKRAGNDDFAPVFADLNIRVGTLTRLLKKNEEALECFDDGISKYRKIVKDADEPVASSIVGLASSYNEKGDLINSTVNHFMAQQWFNKAHRLFDEFEDVLADSPRAKYEEARTYFLQSMQYKWGGPGRGGGGRGRGGRPGRETGRTASQRDERGERRDGNPDSRDPGMREPGMRDAGGPRSGGSRRGRGEGGSPNERSFAGGGERDRAQHLQKAIDLLGPLVKTETNPEYRYLLARCYTVLATNGDRGGRPDPMGGNRPQDKIRNASIGEAVRLLSQLVKEQPNVPDYKYEYVLASLEMRAVDLAERVKITERSHQIAAEIATSNPAVSDYAMLRLKTQIEHAFALERLTTESRRLPAGKRVVLLEDARKMLEQAKATIESQNQTPDAERIGRSSTREVSRFLSERIDRLGIQRTLTKAEALRNDKQEAEANVLLTELRADLLGQLEKEVRQRSRSNGPPGLDKLTELSIAACHTEEQLEDTESAITLAYRLVDGRVAALGGDSISITNKWSTELLRARILQALRQKPDAKRIFVDLREQLGNEVSSVFSGDMPSSRQEFQQLWAAERLYEQVLRELDDYEGLQQLERHKNEMRRQFFSLFSRSRGGPGGGRPGTGGRSGNDGRGQRGDGGRDGRRPARPE